MISARQKRVEEVFLAAAECADPHERERLLRELCGDDADLAAEVRSLLGGHDQVRGVLDRRTVAVPASLGLSLGERTGGRAGEHPAGARIAGYTLLKVLGAGGMGIVYIAEQERPRRTVAIKLIRSAMAGPMLLRRFEAEAEILARLHHPGIAQVFEAGSAPVIPGPAAPAPPAPVPFLAMELVDGPPINEYCEHRSLSTRQRIELVAAACDAVQHAHQRGVIHRDLKPSNILVDSSGRPKILDFGVARVTDADIRVTTLQTSVGQLIGTLPYMSPEQVAGDPDAVDTRSDVYALGVVLYQVLTGRLPHDVSSRSIPEAARIIRDEHPSRLSSISKTFRGDVDTIVAKALEKDKSRRYQSAAELAQDLRRFLTGEPIAAKRDSLGYVLNKKIRRYRLVISVGAAAIVALAALGAYAAAAAVKNRRLAADLTVQLSNSNVERARLLARGDQLPIAEEMLWDEWIRRPDSMLARWALWDLYARSPRLRSLPDRGFTCSDIAFSPDAERIAIAGRTVGHVEIWDRRLTCRLALLSTSSRTALNLAFSPDSRRLAVGSHEGRLRIFNLDRPADPPAARDVEDWTGPLIFTPDGTQLIRGGRNGALALLDASTLQTLRQWTSPSGDVHSLALDPAGRTLAVTGSDDAIRLFDLESAGEVLTLDQHAGGHTFHVMGARFSPDGSALASVGLDHQLKVWDLATRSVRFSVPNLHGPPGNVAFSPDGARVYITHAGLEAFDAHTGNSAGLLVPLTDGRVEAALDPRGRLIAAGLAGGRVILCETRPRSAAIDLPQAVGYGAETAFALDDAGDPWLLSPGPGATLRIRRIEADGFAESFEDLPAHAGPIRAISASKNAGGWIATSAMDGVVRLWSLPERRCVGSVTIIPEGQAATNIALAPDGTRLAVAAPEGRLQIFSVPGLNLERELDAQPTVARAVIFQLAWSPDSRLLTAASNFRFTPIWDARTGELLVKAAITSDMQTALTFTPDSRTLILAGQADIVAFDIAARQTTARFRGHAQALNALAFITPDLLASAGRDRTIRLWSWPDGDPLLILNIDGEHPASLAVSPDSRFLASSLSKGVVRCWDLWRHNASLAGNLEYHLTRAGADLTDQQRERIRRTASALPLPEDLADD